MKLPAGFTEEIASYNAECLSNLVETLETTSPELSIRLNRSKGCLPPASADRVPWCDDGIYLDERPAFTFDPALHQGLYYVQDASSMSITQAIKAICETVGTRPLTYLDACAAPGGKTTAAIAALPEGSVVLANEYDYSRAAVLAENIAKWGAPNVIVSRGDTSRLAGLRNVFDIIAADVPCSGEGMMRKDAEAVGQWSAALVRECVARQKEIVGNLWPALRPGGCLIYSTCTFNRHENEEMVDYICETFDAETIDIGLDRFDGVCRGIDNGHFCYRFIPGRIRGEGLFISVIRKPGDTQRSEPKAAKKPVSSFTKVDVSAVAKWLTGNFKFVGFHDSIFALPQTWTKWMTDAASCLDILSAGVNIATVKGRDIIPSQQLALSLALDSDAFPSVEVDYPTAIRYLRRDTITIDAPRGYILLKYKKQPLGFVKNLGSRANNLYPAPWRILHR